MRDGVRFCHGSPVSDVRSFLPEPGDDEEELLAGVEEPRLVFGHTHLPFARLSAGGIELVNPGSVGCPRYAGNAAPRRNEAGSPHARYAVVTRRAGVWSAELFVLEYDWAPVVSRARSVGFDDWADAFGRDD